MPNKRVVRMPGGAWKREVFETKDVVEEAETQPIAEPEPVKKVRRKRKTTKKASDETPEKEQEAGEEN
jgi:hypothetical protein